MTNEIITGIGGLLLAVLTYFAGVYRTELRYKKQAKEKRIEGVINKYMEFRRNNETAGLDGLQRSGVATLRNDEEIREVVDTIIKYGERDPLKGLALEMNQIDLKVFFDEAAKKKLNFFDSKSLKTFIDSIKEVKRRY